MPSRSPRPLVRPASLFLLMAPIASVATSGNAFLDQARVNSRVLLGSCSYLAADILTAKDMPKYLVAVDARVIRTHQVGLVDVSVVPATLQCAAQAVEPIPNHSRSSSVRP